MILKRWLSHLSFQMAHSFNHFVTSCLPSLYTVLCSLGLQGTRLKGFVLKVALLGVSGTSGRRSLVGKSLGSGWDVVGMGVVP